MISDIQSTHRMRENQEWIHPANIQLNDLGPNVSDRYSDISSPNRNSFIHDQCQNSAEGQKKALTRYNQEEQHQTQREHLKMEIQEQNEQQISSSYRGLSNKQSKAKSKSTSQNFSTQKRQSKLNIFSNLYTEKSQMIYKTKKIIKKFLKEDKPIQLSDKAKSVLSVFKRIYNFIQVVRVFTRSHSITAEQFRLINDISSHRFDKQSLHKQKILTLNDIKNGLWKILDFIVGLGGLNRLIFKNKVSLLPTDQINVIWMLFQLFFNFFALYYASIYIVFDFRSRLLEIDEGVSKASSIYTTNVYILIFTTILDVIKGFNTAFYRKGETIIDRKEIAINYIYGRFFFDFLSLFSVVFSRTFFPDMDKLLMYRIQFLFLFKIHNIQHVIYVFQKTFIMNEKYDNIISLLRLMGILCISSHVGAIMYHCQAQFQIYYMNSNQTWLDQAGILNENYWVRYINSFFCSAGTLVNAIVYNPKTTIETVYMTFTLLGNCCIFGYVINELGNIMDNIVKNQKNSQKELRLINSYMETKNVNRELQTRIRNYLEYMHREERQLNLEETKQVIEKLSSQLKIELVKEVNIQYVAVFHILNKIFSQKIQEKSLFIMNDIKFTPGEVIFLEGDYDDCSIYLILEGQVNIYHTNNKDEDYIVQNLKKGQCFGEIAFFTGQQRNASARSNEFTTLIKIEREQFIQLIKEHSQDDYETFQQINHKIQQSQDYSQIYEKNTKQGKCYTCGNINHISKNCTLTHFQPLPVAVIQTGNRSFQQDRQFKSRSKKNKWHPRKNLNLIKMEEAAQRAGEEYITIIEEINYNILDQSDYDIDQSIEYQNNQDRFMNYEKQNTRDNNQFMLLSNQDNVEGILARGDQKNLSFNFTSNLFQDSKKENQQYPPYDYTKQEGKDFRENHKKIDSNNSIQNKDIQYLKDQLQRRGSKFAPLQTHTLTQIQESPTYLQQGSQPNSQQGNIYSSNQQQQQQHLNAMFNGLMAQNNSFQSPNYNIQITSPKNNNNQVQRISKKQGTHNYSGTYIARKLMGKSQIPPFDSFPRQNTNQTNIANGAYQNNFEENKMQLVNNKMKDSFINLVEIFKSNVSLQIDFMRNYKKYFPDWNISEIERKNKCKLASKNLYDSNKNSITKRNLISNKIFSKKSNKASDYFSQLNTRKNQKNDNLNPKNKNEEE
ncbi:cyclic nucleotide-binding domain protein (macronuclear) [Tetrahymena thermophila SB210]|uniref:Cyclic nucleotide-binding domain protein n=1 Tax=Tetrahymena thermophila (strain SB210) TaxID=312017 RepID=I7LTJ6_TETTS|nr:cyclic nucleotide-binding domain protein [Tetrahymena thermophila SB210]EAR85369.2 cyclic nucleotide-binding domain protein [Tetrahymena thermophila SB210]|eukprot:XP_001033032.2 cyclic nucleotide-binding domain protein [Tetrahymena thermophila SB210]